MFDIMLKRRSERDYTAEPIEEKKIEKILRAGTFAPSGKNGQPWRFAVIQKDKELLRKIAACTVYGHFVQKADCLICVFLDKAESYNYIKDCQAIGACIENMLLEITELNLGACWIGEILNRDAEVKKLLGIDNRYDLMAVLSIGNPAPGKEQKTARRPLEDLMLMSL